MSRVKKQKLRKQIRRTIYLPISACIVFMFIFIIVVDYRINNTLGIGGVRVFNIIHTEQDVLSFNTMGHHVANIDLTYIKKDISKLNNKLVEFINDTKDYTKNVFIQNHK